MTAPIDEIIKDMPEQPSVAAAGKYLAERIKEPKALVKALHDFVALRLTYDHDAASIGLAWELL